MREHRGRVRGAAAYAVVPLLVLAGCGDEPAGEPPDFTGEEVALWNPCDALDTDDVERAYGSVAQEENGTRTAPDCRFVPDEETGQAAVTVNYQLAPAGLEDLWETMGQPEGADVTDPVVEGADAAKIVVSVVKKQLYVSGFVQNGSLVQLVNVVDPAPYDEARAVRGTRQLLALLSRHADDNGVTGTATPEP
jgi:hypothetical protein